MRRVLVSSLILAASLLTACGVTGQSAQPTGATAGPSAAQSEAGGAAARPAGGQAGGAAGVAQSGAARQGGGGGPTVPVAVASVEQGPMRAGPTFTGDVVALQQVNLVPRSAGVIVKINVEVGEEVSAGQVVAELDHATQDASVSSATASLDSAQARLDQILSGPKDTDLARAQAALDSAAANLESANSRLNALINGSKPQDVENARLALDSAVQRLDALKRGPRQEQIYVYQKGIEAAQNSLTAAQAQANGDCGGRQLGYVCDASRARVHAAETTLNLAKLQYELNVAPPTQTDLAQAENVVAQAQAALDKLLNPYTQEDLIQAQAAVAVQQSGLVSAQAAYAAAADPYTSSDVRVAQSAVRTARAQLDSALVSKSQTSVAAPFEGVIGSRLLAEGALANTTTPIFTLVSRNVGVDLAVSQEAIAQLATGQAADIRSPGVPGQTIAGLVYSVSPSADPRTRTFQVRVVPQSQDGRLHAGMSASVSLNTVAEEQAVLVPTDAIVSPSGATGQGVFVVEDRGGSMVASFKTPTFGASSGRMTQILGGLTLGERVVVQGQASLANNQGVRVISGAPAGAPAPGNQPQGGGNRG